MESLPKMKLEFDDSEQLDHATAEEDESAMEQDPEEATEDDDDDDDGYVEEEMLLFVDFENYLAADELKNPNVRVKVIGIDSENPVIQVNNDVYKGSYDYPMGTSVFLEEDDAGKAALDPLYSSNPPKLYKYAGQSSKVLKMKRIFITPKTDVATTTVVKNEPETADDIRSKESERLIVTRSYEEALNLHLPQGCYPPRHIELENNCEKVVQRKTMKLTTVESDIEDDARRDDPTDADYVPGM